MHVLRLFEFCLSELVNLLELLLSGQLFTKTLLGCTKLFLGSIEALHLLSQNSVDCGDVGTLIVQFGSKGRQLILENGNLALERFLIFLLSGEFLSDLGQFAILCLNVVLGGTIVFLLSFEALLVLVKVIFALVKGVLVLAEALTSFVDKLVTLA